MATIRDRITGETVEGVVLADDADGQVDQVECPECGAGAGDQCTEGGLGELGPYVHIEREDACGVPDAELVQHDGTAVA